MTTNELHKLADELDRAERERAPVQALSSRGVPMTEEDAYGVQQINAGRALKDGRRLVGYKLGLTSREAQRQFQVFEPDFGHLFDHMAVLEEEELDLSTLIQPKIEGEIALVMKRELKGPGVTIVDVLGAVDYAVAALEIVDSRIRDWKIKAVDTIADNGSSARFVLAGVKHSIKDLDLRTIGMALSKNGEVMVTGAGSAVMGNPLSAVAFLANQLGKHDRGLIPGQIVLSGALSSMLSIAPGDAFDCQMAKLGRVGVRFKNKGASL